MKKLLTAVFCSAIFITTPVMAGAGHDHGHARKEITSVQVTKLASEKLGSLVTAGKIDSTWAGVESSSVEKKTFDKGPEWVVTFKNAKVADAEKQALYVFYSLDGQYIAANYTGE